MWNKQRSR
jgi:hypothetical protein